jgi:ABC-2 type transport system permease protein
MTIYSRAQASRITQPSLNISQGYASFGLNDSELLGLSGSNWPFCFGMAIITDEVKDIMQKYRYSAILLRELVVTDFKLRYQNSALGYLWSLLRPFALFLIMYVVFVMFLKIGSSVPHFPVYLLFGLVVWNFFSEVTNHGVTSIVNRGDVLRKINFPKYVIVLAVSVSALINLLINLLVVLVFMVASGVSMQFMSFLFVPLLVIELFVLSLSLAFFLSAFFVKFRDVNYIWEVFMQAAFYATPIFYPINSISAKVAGLLLLNPVAQIMQDLRYLLITDKTVTIGTLYHSEWARLIPIALVVVIAIGSMSYFKKHSRFFAEEI